MSGATALVTGATGFVAAELIAQLLADGRSVRGTVRSASGEYSRFLHDLPGAEGNLELVEADLLADGWNEVVDGCAEIFHVASPYALTVDDPERDLLRPAVDGTLRVLAAADAVGGVRRVVLTSSIAAVLGADHTEPYDESCWNDVASLDFNPYYYAKTRAELAAWEFMGARDREFDLVALNLAGVIGPVIVPRLNESHTLLSGMTDGSQPAIVAIDWPMVDVRDAAAAHVSAMARPSASGRYIISGWNVTPRDAYDVAGDLGLRTVYPFPKIMLDRGLGVPISRAFVPFQPKGLRDHLRLVLGRRVVVDGSRAEGELEIVHRPARTSLADTWSSLHEWGLLGRQP